MMSKRRALKYTFLKVPVSMLPHACDARSLPGSPSLPATSAASLPKLLVLSLTRFTRLPGSSRRASAWLAESCAPRTASGTQRQGRSLMLKRQQGNTTIESCCGRYASTPAAGMAEQHNKKLTRQEYENVSSCAAAHLCEEVPAAGEVHAVCVHSARCRGLAHRAARLYDLQAQLAELPAGTYRNRNDESMNPGHVGHAGHTWSHAVSGRAGPPCQHLGTIEASKRKKNAKRLRAACNVGLEWRAALAAHKSVQKHTIVQMRQFKPVIPKFFTFSSSRCDWLPSRTVAPVEAVILAPLGCNARLNMPPAALAWHKQMLSRP